MLGESGSWNFQGGRKNDGRKAKEKMVTIERLTKTIFQKNRRGGGVASTPPLCRRGLKLLGQPITLQVVFIRVTMVAMTTVPNHGRCHNYYHSGSVIQCSLWLTTLLFLFAGWKNDIKNMHSFSEKINEVFTTLCRQSCTFWRSFMKMTDNAVLPIGNSQHIFKNLPRWTVSQFS